MMKMMLMVATRCMWRIVILVFVFLWYKCRDYAHDCIETKKRSALYDKDRKYVKLALLRSYAAILNYKGQ